ncbi:hypothetical protein ANT2_0718 [plant metagenome]|uniref:Uncharacterized protein n=1 Tax=plant metagenome TaxID=1297885 RepID=A0A484TUD5_9ZZZZ
MAWARGIMKRGKEWGETGSVDAGLGRRIRALPGRRTVYSRKSGGHSTAKPVYHPRPQEKNVTPAPRAATLRLGQPAGIRSA